jgi:hypothetical protein
MRVKTSATFVVLLLVVSSCTTEDLPTSPQLATVSSDASAKSDNAAVVYTKPTLAAIGENWCALWGSDHEIYVDWDVKAIVNLQTKTGTEVFTCRLQGIFNDTGEVLYFGPDNLPPGSLDEDDPATYMAGTFFGFTANWWARVMPSGKAVLQGHVNPSDDNYLSFEEYCELYPDGAGSWACG